MIHWLTVIGLSADLVDKVRSMINAGLTIATVISFLSSAGVGSGIILALKGIFKKRGLVAVLH